jgi:hypothetical protein
VLAVVVIVAAVVLVGISAINSVVDVVLVAVVSIGSMMWSIWGLLLSARVLAQPEKVIAVMARITNTITKKCLLLIVIFLPEKEPPCIAWDIITITGN